MGQDETLGEMIKNISETATQCVKNAGYYAIDTIEGTIDEIQFKKWEREEEKRNEQDIERQKKVKRLQECERIIAETAIMDIDSVYQERKRLLGDLENESNIWEKKLIKESREFRKYYLKREIAGVLFAIAIVSALVGLAGEALLLLVALLLFVLSILVIAVAEKAEKKSDAVAPPEYLELKNRLYIAKKEVEKLDTIKNIRKEAALLKKELSE